MRLAPWIRSFSSGSELRNVLIVAYHFPPCVGSSGVLRPLKFARYLPEFGWRPTILTTRTLAYEETDPRSLDDIPKDLRVIRTWAIDAKKHLGIGGLYQDWMAMPDRWASWLASAVAAGLRAVREEKIDVIFTTFPIATTVLIGYALHILTRKPWVVDFRDSMTEDNYPSSAFRRRIWRAIERRTMRRANHVLFTAASTRRMYLSRYPWLPPEKCSLISNGYDEEDLRSLEGHRSPESTSAVLRLLHTGMLYREERDPRPFFRALARLKREATVSDQTLRVTLRNPCSEEFYQSILNELNIADIVSIQPHLPHQQALAECADSDALVLFQSASCDHQIPAKAYEYLRLGKPVLALTTETGDTASLLNEVGGATIMDLASEEQIYKRLPTFLAAVRAGTHTLPDLDKIRRYARRNQTEELAKVLFEASGAAMSVPELSATRTPLAR
jgi:glycosyltransferase involved in cell wall biosynthesis